VRAGGRDPFWTGRELAAPVDGKATMLVENLRCADGQSSSPQLPDGRGNLPIKDADGVAILGGISGAAVAEFIEARFRPAASISPSALIAAPTRAGIAGG